MPLSISALTSYDSRYKSIAAFSIPSIRAFADKQNYTLRAVERDDCTRPGGWMKIESILSALEDGFDFVLWLDADTYAARKDIDIRKVIWPEIHLHLAWHRTPPALGRSAALQHRRDAHSRVGLEPAIFRRVWETGPLSHRWIKPRSSTCWDTIGFWDRSADIERMPVSQLNITWNSIPNACALEDPII